MLGKSQSKVAVVFVTQLFENHFVPQTFLTKNSLLCNDCFEQVTWVVVDADDIVLRGTLLTGQMFPVN